MLHADREQARMEARLLRLQADVPPQPHRNGLDLPQLEDELDELSAMVNGREEVNVALEDEDELRAQHLKQRRPLGPKRVAPAPQAQAQRKPTAPKEAAVKSTTQVPVVKDPTGRRCWHYAKDECKFGNRCKFVHEDCKAFLEKGKCRYGDSCKFRHPPPQTEQLNASGEQEQSNQALIGSDSKQSSSSKSAPVASATDQLLHFAYTPTSLQTSLLEVAYPKLKFSSGNGPVPSVNPHLCLHMERFFLMEETVRIMESLPTRWTPGDPPDLVDHWGAPLRLWKALKTAYSQHPTCRALQPQERQAWMEMRASRWLSNVPSVISNDDLRHHLATGVPPPVRVCRCEDFPCEHAPEPIAILDVHGLYYRSPSSITDMLARTGAVMYSIAHWFNPEQGTGEFWGGEGRWRRDDGTAATVTMDVDGATVRSYRHSDLSWLARLPLRRGPLALGVDLVMQHPAQRCYCFRTTEDPWVNEDKPEEQLSFVASASPSVWGLVDLFPQQKALATESMKVGAIQLYSMGPFWDWASDDRHVWVSKAMVEQGARYMAGQTRSPETRNNLIMWLERKMRVNGAHPDVTAASIHVTAFLALLLHTEESMWAMHAFNGMGVFMATWNQLMEGKPMRCWHWWMLALACFLLALVPKIVVWSIDTEPGVAAGFFSNFTNSSGSAGHASNLRRLMARAPPPEDINMIFWAGLALITLLLRYCLMTREWMDKRALVANWVWPTQNSKQVRVSPPHTFADVAEVHRCTRAEFRDQHTGPCGRVNKYAVRAVVPVPKPFASDSKLVLSANPLERRVRCSAHLTYSATFPDIMPSVPSTGPASLAGAASRLAAVYYDKDNEEVVDLNLDAVADWYERKDCANFDAMVQMAVASWGAGRTPEQLAAWFEGCRARVCWDVDQSRFDSHQREKLKRLVHRLMKRIHERTAAGPEEVMSHHEKAYTYMTERMGGRTAHFSYRTSTLNASGSGARREECFRVFLEGCAVTGAMETSDFATLTEILLIFYVLARHMVNPSTAPERFRILCCGDDTVVKWLGKRTCTIAEFEEDMRCLGMKAKVHETVNGENTVYCSSLAWIGHCVNGKNAGANVPILGPLPFRQLSKFSTMCNPPLGFTRAEAARGKAMSMIKRANHVPLLGTYLRRVLEYTSDVSDARAAIVAERERMKRWAADSEDGPYELTTEAVQQFLDRYDMSMDEYRRLDAMMATHDPDHYYRDDQLNRCLVIDCDVSDEQGSFQTTDHLQSSPFRPHYDTDSSLATARLMGQPFDLLAAGVEWPTVAALDFAEWFEGYKANVGGAMVRDGVAMPGRAANVLSEHNRMQSGDTRSIDYAVRNTDVLVKVEALCKSAYGVDEHFAPRAIESDKEAMIAACGPYVKTIHRACHELFPCPGAVAVNHHIRLQLPKQHRPVDRCLPRVRRYKWLIVWACLALLVAAIVGARADPETQKYQSGHVHRERRDVYHDRYAALASYAQRVVPINQPAQDTPLPYVGLLPPPTGQRQSMPRGKANPAPAKSAPRGRPPRARPVVQRVEKTVVRAAPRARRPRRQRAAPAGAGRMSAVAPVAVAFDYRPIRTSKQTRDGRVVRVSDVLWEVPNTEVQTLLDLPFTFDLSDIAATGSSAVATLLRQESTMYARYKVRKAVAMWKPTCASGTPGSVCIAIIPGEQQSPASVREMALYKEAAYGNLWAEHQTKPWRAHESRLWNTQRGGPVGIAGSVDQAYPFRVAVATSGNQTSDSTHPSLGTVFLDVEIEFIDPCPPLASSIQLGVDLTKPNAFSTLGLFWKAIVFNRVYQMTGDWGWNALGTNRLPVSLPPPDAAGGTAVGAMQNDPAASQVRLEVGFYMFSLRLSLAATSLGSVHTDDTEPVLVSMEQSPAESKLPGPLAAGDVVFAIAQTYFGDDLTVKTIYYRTSNNSGAADFNYIGTLNITVPCVVQFLAETAENRTINNNILLGIQRYA